MWKLDGALRLILSAGATRDDNSGCGRDVEIETQAPSGTRVGMGGAFA
jgi:hypothetical protein